MHAGSPLEKGYTFPMERAFKNATVHAGLNFPLIDQPFTDDANDVDSPLENLRNL